MTAKRGRVLVIQHQEDAGLGHFARHLRDSGIDLITLRPDTGTEIPHSLDNVDGLIVLGGSMGPTDDEVAPWLPATRALLAEAVRDEIPTFGICLGAQLLTTAVGGQVHEMPQGPEVGLLSVQFSPEAANDPLFGVIGESEVPVLQWHWLEAERLPEGAQVLASSEGCANQIFRLGEQAWGVQFHPEALSDTAQEWADESGSELTELGLDGSVIVADVREFEPKLREIWGIIAVRFAQIVEGHKG
jgi:GMP synthase (glutamine-hydrolysing)